MASEAQKKEIKVAKPTTKYFTRLKAQVSGDKAKRAVKVATNRQRARKQ